MKPNFEEIITLYTSLHGREPSEEEREKLRQKLGYSLVFEPDWELLARPTGLGPSWLGLLWLVLDSGPAAKHPGVTVALEWLQGERWTKRELAPGEHWRSLTRAMNLLVARERQPRGELAHFLRIVEERAACSQCNVPVGPGLVGWYTGNKEGPLCRPCLRENAPSLAVLGDAAAFGLPKALRMAGNTLSSLLDEAPAGETPEEQSQEAAP